MLINDKVDAVYIPDSPSRIKATDYNQIKNEIQECIREAGLTPTKDVIQLPQALKILTAQSGAEEVAKIEAAGQEQLDEINTAGQTQTAAVNEAGSTQTEAVNAAGQKQLNAINTAGAQAVQDAQTAANTATAKATEAAGSASAAASSASAASESAGTATTQAANAAASAELAQKWATQTTAEVVSGQGYGAKYYADQAADSAASIVGDAEAAAASATEASASASQAAQSAQEAAQSAAVISPDSYVKKSGDTMTGPLKLPAPAVGLNDNTAITAAWARALITGKTIVKDYITERFSDETGNWYELYASGWIKQGGIGVYTGLVGEQTVTLLKPMANANYSLMPLMVSKRGGYDQFPVLTSVTTTNFKFTVVNALAGVAPLFTWRAEGYKAQGA